MFSTPALRVAAEEGQPAQAPRMCSHTTPVSGSKRGEQDVAAVLGHGRADARVQQVLDLGHDLGAFAFVDRFRRRLRVAIGEQGPVAGEVVHDRRQDRGLEMRPVAITVLGHGQEVRAEEDPDHAVQIEQVRGQGRGPRLVRVAKLPSPGAQHFAAGQEFQDGGVGRGFGLDEHLAVSVER